MFQIPTSNSLAQFRSLLQHRTHVRPIQLRCQHNLCPRHRIHQLRPKSHVQFKSPGTQSLPALVMGNLASLHNGLRLPILARLVKTIYRSLTAIAHTLPRWDSVLRVNPLRPPRLQRRWDPQHPDLLSCLPRPTVLFVHFQLAAWHHRHSKHNILIRRLSGQYRRLSHSP